MLKAEFLTRYKEPIRQVDRLRTLEGRRSDNVIVMKFGGAALGNAEMIDRNSKLIAEYFHRGFGVIPVVSAMSAITERLIDLSQTENLEIALDKAESIALFHGRIARELFGERSIMGELRALRASLIKDVKIPERSEEREDKLKSYGEMYGARLMARTLHRNLQSGSAEHLDAVSVLVTDDKFGEAIPDDRMSSVRMRNLKYYLDAGIVPVITGFIGATLDGRVTTLGRNGSDFSASYIARHVGANMIIFWKDVEGVYTADPSTNPDAAIIPYLTYEKAQEMMIDGGMKVLHPKAICAARISEIPIQVRSFLIPEKDGTIIA